MLDHSISATAHDLIAPQAWESQDAHSALRIRVVRIRLGSVVTVHHLSWDSMFEAISTRLASLARRRQQTYYED